MAPGLLHPRPTTNHDSDDDDDLDPTAAHAVHRPQNAPMSPGGHLVTTALACAGTYTLTGSAALTAGVAAGGFLIDVDHVLDYVLFEGQRDLRPAAFLRYYSEQRMRRVALLLHSYELIAALAALAWGTGSVWLWGYVLGTLLHLPLDIYFNGRVLSKNLVPFYSLAYRLRLGFRAGPLLGLTIQRSAGSFWRSFFAEFVPGGPGAPVRERDAAALESGSRRLA